MTDDILEKLRATGWDDTCSAAADEIERLRRVNQILEKVAMNWERTARTLAQELNMVDDVLEVFEDFYDGLYDKVRERIHREEGETKQQVEELVRKNQDLNAYAEQDACIADNLRSELKDMRWKLGHAIYCPVKKTCHICIEIEKEICCPQ